MRLRWLVICGVLAGQLAQADPISSGAAADVLYDTQSVGLQLSQSLTEKERATVKALVPLIETQTGTKAKFFGALAYAPDEGLVSEALQGAFNFHSTEAADRAALEACDAARKSGSGPCRLAARIVPPGYKAGDLTLSMDATAVFFSRFLPATGSKFFAASRSTGAWAMAPTQAGALVACAQDARSANDCSIVVKN